MVSPAPSTAPPTLSWAERAKKAQPAKAQSTSQRTAQQGTSSLAPVHVSSVARSAPIVPPPLVSKISSSGSVGPDTRTPTVTTQSPPSPPHSAVSPSSIPVSDRKPNGDVNDHDASLPMLSSNTSAQKHGPAPTANVWDLRKEKMAARVLMQPRSPQATTQTSTVSLLAPPPAATQSLVPSDASTSTSTTAISTAKSSPSISQPAGNGHLAPSTDYDDPFVVKPGRSPSSLNITPPAIDDAESWPEVGQAAVPVNGKKEGREGEEKGHERESSQGHGSRKSEKTKWVPVPPEDLQFEGPARSQHVRQRSQNQDRSQHRQVGGPSGAGSSSSGQGSQQQSRTHSAAGRRTTPSHAGSVSHSQTQSRTGSVHSSPRHSSIRGNGKRLPEEASGPIFATNRSLRSSRTNSPSTFAQPQPLPTQDSIPGGRPYVNTSVMQGRDLSALSAIPDSAAGEMNPHAAFFHPPPFGVSPYHSPQPPASPASNLYALPPLSYAGQPVPGHLPMSGYGTPPYPMYPPPYGYPYAHAPYMYWPPQGAPPPHLITSPMTNAQLSEGIPPPTMMARPPPPNESDAVAGYRDVGFVLPPPAEQTIPEQREERGRRVRELSFGSISAGLGGTSGCSSPAPTSPALVLGAVPEGAALGLDVSGGQPPALVEAETTPVPSDGVVGESRSFTVFSIGVAPGETGPTRLRSRTRTLSRGPATSVSGRETFLEQEAQVVEKDPVEVLAETAAQVIDLTDSETIWEFGTTKTAEDVNEGLVEPAAAPTSDGTNVDVPPGGSATTPGVNFVPMMAHYANAPPFVPPIAITGASVNGMPSGPSPSAYTPRQDDEWEVRDYGYGFGRGGPGPVYPQAAVPPHREDRPYRERPYQQGDREYYGRPRRGSYGQYGYDRGGERGSYSGRRGRAGLSGGYNGRGYSNRSYAGRGGYSGPGQRQPAYVPPTQPQADVNGYYAPPIAPIATYIPQPYDNHPYTPQYSHPPPPPQTLNAQPHPPPVPQSAVGFPLDSTRYYLLGQLEYYLSAQNLTRDFYLRQQMDSCGWIPITLIASFNRVRALTMDEQFVTDVLSLSSLVEVKANHVRCRQWQQFVLPTAPASVVETDGVQGQVVGETLSVQHPHPQEEAHQESQNHDVEDDEEEDVVFVM